MLLVHPNSEERWGYAVSQTGSHIKIKHPAKKGLLIVPNHGSSEVGKGLELRLRKLAGLN